MDENLSLIANHAEATIAAIAALGTSAYGLVDTTKVLWGGVSRVGYGRIREALLPFSPALVNALGVNWANAIYSMWLNGAPLDEQKAKAKSLIRLGLTSENAEELANAGTHKTTELFDPTVRPDGVSFRQSLQYRFYKGDLDDYGAQHKIETAQFSGSIDGGSLRIAVDKLTKGTELQQADINILGRFDATVDAALDAAYERADRQYRNAARALAAGIAMGLAIVGGELLSHSWRTDLVPAIVVGLIAVPLAPIAKDLSSALANAVSAMNAVSGKKS